MSMISNQTELSDWPPATKSARAPWQVAEDVIGLPQLMVNCVFNGSPEAGDRQWTLIDAAMPWSNRAIIDTAEERFGPQSRPAAIVLTHGHFDHIGNVAKLADYWSVPIYAHKLELPYLTGRSSYPPPDPAVGGGAMSFLSRFLPAGPVNLGNRINALPDDGSVPGMSEWKWVHTPGHTPGHIALFRDKDRMLIAGDAFVTQHQESLLGIVTRQPEVRRPPAYFTPDWNAARQSVEALTALEPIVAVTGHGIPMSGPQLQNGLQSLLDNWNRVARPHFGRYVRSPAVADERGVVSVPPPVVDRHLVALSAMGLLSAITIALLRRSDYR
jgi:glyoxylase-like metal-dependent hydrolase (beta-lactamase superfamily II)